MLMTRFDEHRVFTPELLARPTKCKVTLTPVDQITDNNFKQ